MNNSLIFKGLQSNDEETIRKVKSTFIAELELSVDKVTEIFDNPPTVIIEGVEEEKLERFKKLLEEAGAVIELKDNKPLAHWLEDEDFEEEENLNSDNETIEFDDSPLELEGSLFKDDEVSSKSKDSIEYESSGLCFDDDTSDQTDNNTMNESSGLSLEEDSTGNDADLTIDFDDDSETLSVETETLSLEAEPQIDSQEEVIESTEPDLSITMEEPPAQPAIEEEAPQEVKEAASVKAEKIEEPPAEPVVQEMQDIKVPKLHYKKTTKKKLPWDVIIIATIGVILLFIANWFYFRG